MSSGFGPRSAPTFSQGTAPRGYVAGIGRGAIGFSTRSDIGPGTNASGSKVGASSSLGIVPPTLSVVGVNGTSAPRIGTNVADAQFGVAPAGYVAGRGRAMGALAYDQKELITTNDHSVTAPENSSIAFTGDSSLDREDAEADQIYSAVDARIDSRRLKRKTDDLLEGSNRRPRICDQFSDLKATLAKVTTEEWDALPEVGDHSLKLTQKSRFANTTTAIPDSFLSNSKLGQDTALHRASAGDDIGTKNVLAGMAAARESKLGSKLDRLSDDVTGQTVVDPQGYMTSLGSIKVSSNAEVGDVKRARLLLSSVTSTNPQHAPGWIAAARLEEVAGKSGAARRLAEQGCKSCPDSEDLWLECARLHDGRAAQSVLARAVLVLPHNTKIWLAAAALESDIPRRKVVLRRALELVPSSPELWRAAIELEDTENAKILLGRAVECVPHSVEMWLALARIETHTNARQVLNRMRQVLPTEPLTWLTASRLEEAHGAQMDTINKIVARMLAALRQGQVVTGRDEWLKQAIICETADAPLTCRSLVKATIEQDVATEDRLDTWAADAEALLTKSPPYPVTARALLDYAVDAFPTDRGLWSSLITLEREHGKSSDVMNVLRRAVEACPTVEVFWLMAAKHAWKGSNSDTRPGITDARIILEKASAENPHSEPIWLAAAKLEWESNEPARARALLSKARITASSPRVWVKSLLLERDQGETKTLVDLAESGLKEYPKEFKLYLIAGQVCEEDLNQLNDARELYKRGTENCHKCAPMWVHLSLLEERDGNMNKARAVLEKGRSRMHGIDGEDMLWLFGTRLERRAGNEQAAVTLLAHGLQRLPNSGLLWSEDLLTCSKAAQKSKSIDALKRCENNAQVVLAIGRLFIRDRKTEKARKWIERAASLQPKLGDAWAHLYSFELQIHAQLFDRDVPKEELEQQQDVLNNIEKRCMEAEPNRGELWNSIHKRTENRHKSPVAILKRCVAEITKNIL